MSLQAKLILTALALANGLLILELLRKRKLTESYTLLWLLVIGSMFIATWADQSLYYLTRLFGAIAPVSTLTLLSLAFVLVMLIFFSMKISKLERLLKELAQYVALDNVRHPRG
jgi:hypothetical protein